MSIPEPDGEPDDPEAIILCELHNLIDRCLDNSDLSIYAIVGILEQIQMDLMAMHSMPCGEGE